MSPDDPGSPTLSPSPTPTPTPSSTPSPTGAEGGSDWRPLTPATTPPERRGVGVIAGVVALLVAGLLLVLLVVQNTQHAQLHLLWFDADLSLSALVVGTAFVAIVVDEVAGLAWRRRRRRYLDLKDRAG